MELAPSYFSRGLSVKTLEKMHGSKAEVGSNGELVVKVPSDKEMSVVVEAAWCDDVKQDSLFLEESSWF